MKPDCDPAIPAVAPPRMQIQPGKPPPSARDQPPESSVEQAGAGGASGSEGEKKGIKVVAAGSLELVGLGSVKVVEMEVLLVRTVICARCRVRVLVRVKVLVLVVVVKSSATAASGKRTAAKMVGRCILE
ncbi:hypothetical protein F5144DRAFT_594765 [Chaetomium tenue]|uniref:Uncharacterized protein n=1 Tax=Chaetomium tenue TaxID=1854479 RepID=A0ACB7P980_9PEZI|nr:hypothetical protein F5144DRAFT_594765 [Chaetomium globosum]